MEENIRLFNCVLVQIFQKSYDGVSIDRKKNPEKNPNIDSLAVFTTIYQ